MGPCPYEKGDCIFTNRSFAKGRRTTLSRFGRDRRLHPPKIAREATRIGDAAGARGPDRLWHEAPRDRNAPRRA